MKLHTFKLQLKFEKILTNLTYGIIIDIALSLFLTK